MDKIDHQLLGLLREDARQPLKKLAGAVGLAASSVQSRIRRLVETGEISRFTVVAGNDRRPSAVLIVELDMTPSPAIVRDICERCEVVRCYSLSGEIDLLVELNCDGITELNCVRDDIANLQGVRTVKTSFILKREKH